MVGRANHRGLGLVRRLPSKRWQASYQGPNLCRHGAPRTFGAKGDAEGWLAVERALISAGTWSPPASRRRDGTDFVTFRAYGQTWLRDRRLKPRTREGYEHLLRRYLLPEFGQEVLSSITPPDVRRWRAQLDGLTPTVNARAYALLKAILNTAVADDEIAASRDGGLSGSDGGGSGIGTKTFS